MAIMPYCVSASGEAGWRMGKPGQTPAPKCLLRSMSCSFAQKKNHPVSCIWEAEWGWSCFTAPLGPHLRITSSHLAARRKVPLQESSSNVIRSQRVALLVSWWPKSCSHHCPKQFYHNNTNSQTVILLIQGVSYTFTLLSSSQQPCMVGKNDSFCVCSTRWSLRLSQRHAGIKLLYTLKGMDPAIAITCKLQRSNCPVPFCFRQCSCISSSAVGAHRNLLNFYPAQRNLHLLNFILSCSC